MAAPATGGGCSGDRLCVRSAAVGEVEELVELMSKLNPGAAEFVPSSSFPARNGGGGTVLSAEAPLFVSSSDYYAALLFGGGGGGPARVAPHQQRRRNTHNHGRRRTNLRVKRAQEEDVIKRTVYVSDIDQHITEDELAELFSTCGPVNDCRICGDPHSVLRFAFIEFEEEISARVALYLRGTMLGYYPVRVLPSKTAILPVNPTFLPQSEDERDMCGRTVYCTNIDKQVTETDVRKFFVGSCGEVSRLRLLGDNVHSTCIAFVEFVSAESAMEALNCSGMILGNLPIRVSPSKTPVRTRVP